MASILSDQQGQWSLHQAPRNTHELTFFVTHPEFARLRATIPLTGPGASNVVLRLQPGVSLAGVVVTTNDVPVYNASVEEIDRFGAEGVSARTDIAGRFCVPHVSPAPIELRIEADGYSILTRTIEPSTNDVEARLVLT